MGLDKRIGAKFLHPGPGFGGSCFPKDTIALVKTAEQVGGKISIVEEVVSYNQERKLSMAQRVISQLKTGIKNKKVSILGLAFKPETDDMRDSPALEIISELYSKGANIIAYDPAAMNEAKSFFQDKVVFAEDSESCIRGADVCVIITEWNEFRAIPASKYSDLMNGNVVVDLRNIYSPDEMRGAGLNYSSIGRV